MPDASRGWFHRHINVVTSFLIGMTFGIFSLALAVFSGRNEYAARVLQFGIRITGHADIDEDLVWFFCGITAGAAVACLAWWRDNKAKASEPEEADVLHRIHRIRNLKQ